ncbi:hypothetical protein [Phenylobacterium sp.]|uniref:hypothetical protein n=1 Tax=Phenylobacterium sp. TaxID=1871053 RepID=UPI002810D928|nr:hypothetical protein [Phenylobacterium sp.]
MTICSRRATIAAFALALAGAAQAAEAPDGPMATAGASGAPPTAAAEVQTTAPPIVPAAATPPAPPRSTAEQIDDFIRSSPAAQPSPEEMAAMDEAEIEPERRVRGSFEVGVGTHGYRHARVTAHYPVGKSGHVSVAVGTTRGRGALGYCMGPYGAPAMGPLDAPFAPDCF